MVVMTNSQLIVIIICGVMSLQALRSKKKCCYYIYKDCYIENKVFFWIEKVLMFLLPLVIVALSFIFPFHSFVLKSWMILTVLLDFAFQYFAKTCGWLNYDQNEKLSSGLLIWIIFIIILFFGIKS